ncbi:restriction endonuclease subunit S [Acinetobacter seifertii]|uniref:restriction endonuclease subunit S n=1 Tax=Acinetobacter seifertii TaxID=1530123 RepID=UPI000C1EF495|nr:restriction endonuclease subunit S [Acinetobacter seifertii]PJF03345.1 restriction endonuclease subunit S [Acinetobacter seifertii]PJG71791.1 restriction endonuclease subunit S [Acinetobacter seifertii]
MTRFVLPPLDSTWRTIPLGALAEIKYGSALPSASRAVDGVVPVYGSGGVVGSHDKPLHSEKSIVIGRKGSVGSIFLTQGPFWCIDTAYYLDQLNELINIEYLAAYLHSIDLSRLSISVAVPGLNRKELSLVQVPLPTLPEQQRIVDVLRQVEAVTKARNSINDQMDHIVRTAYWEHFSDWFTADGLINPVRISDYVADSQYGLSEAMAETGTHAVLRMNSITTSGWLDLTDLKYAYLSKKDIESTMLCDGDLLFNRTNSKELVGKCAIWRPVKGTFSFASYLVRLRLKSEMLPEFLWATLNSAYGKYRLLNSAKQAVSMANVSPTDLGRITVPLPPLSLQNKFAKLVREIEALRTQMLGKIEMYSELQEIINQQALLGELTKQWRKVHTSEIIKASRIRDALIREYGAKVILTNTSKVNTIESTDLSVLPSRQWLLAELSEFQRQLLIAFNEYCQQKGQPLTVEDPEVFAHFCNDATVMEQLQVFGQSHGNRIRRSLSQLSALGLIAKITLPKQDLESGEYDYLKAFRPLRTNEFTRLVDIQTLRKAMSSNVEQRSYYFQVHLDFETSENAGASGMFQVISIEDENGDDFTHLVDQGKDYASLEKLKDDLSSELNIDGQQIDLEVI